MPTLGLRKRPHRPELPHQRPRHLHHDLASSSSAATAQHSSYELVPADVQQALLKAYEEAAAE